MEEEQIVDIFDDPGTSLRPLGKARLVKCVYHDAWFEKWIVESILTGITSERLINIQTRKE